MVWTVKDIYELQKFAQSGDIVSLDAPVSDREDAPSLLDELHTTDPYFDPVARAEFNEQLRLVIQLAEQLPEQDQRLLLARFEGCTLEEIAAELKTGGINATRWSMQKAEKRIIDYMRERLAPRANGKPSAIDTIPPVEEDSSYSFYQNPQLEWINSGLRKKGIASKQRLIMCLRELHPRVLHSTADSMVRRLGKEVFLDTNHGQTRCLTVGAKRLASFLGIDRDEFYRNLQSTYKDIGQPAFNIHQSPQFKWLEAVFHEADIFSHHDLLTRMWQHAPEITPASAGVMIGRLKKGLFLTSDSRKLTAAAERLADVLNIEHQTFHSAITLGTLPAPTAPADKARLVTPHLG